MNINIENTEISHYRLSLSQPFENPLLSLKNRLN